MAPVIDQNISYAQRHEDTHLLRAFGAQASGFYIDVGAGHPVYDNVSFAFYLRGWNGITVEFNRWRGKTLARRPIIWSKIFTVYRPRSKTTPAPRRANSASVRRR